MTLEQISKFIVRVMGAYGFDPTIRYYKSGSLDNTLLRAIEGIILPGGYIYVAGRDGQEYVSGGDRSLAIRYNGDRPNIPYLVAGYEGMIEDYYDTVSILDAGGGYTSEEWIVPEEDGGAGMIEHITYNQPIDNNMYVGALAVNDEDISLCNVIAVLLGNYMLINHGHPDKHSRYTHMVDALECVIPTLDIGSSGQCKVLYHNIWISI